MRLRVRSTVLSTVLFLCFLLFVAASPAAVDDATQTEDIKPLHVKRAPYDWFTVKIITDTAGHVTQKIVDVWHHTDAIASQISQHVETMLQMDDNSSSISDFWKKAADLGDRVRQYADELLKEAAQRFQISDKTEQFKASLNAAVESARHLRDEFSSHVNSDKVLDDLSALSDRIIEDLKEQFPAPDAAAGHEDRKLATQIVLNKMEEHILRLGVEHGVPEDNLRAHVDSLKSAIESIVIITGDLIEQHPVLMETLLFYGVIMIIPESWFLRPLLRIFGFGVNGPVKGSLAAWAQRFFWGARVAPGSWFSHLQRAGMKYAAPGWGFLGRIVAGIGAAVGGAWYSCGPGRR